MRTRRNYSDTKEAGNFEPVPDGAYLLEVVKVEDRKTQAGDPMAAVQIKVAEGEYENRRVFHNVVFHEPDAPGAGFTKHWLRIMGQNFEGDVDYDTDDWYRRKFVARVGHEEYKGKAKNVIEASFLPTDKDCPEWREGAGGPPPAPEQGSSEPAQAPVDLDEVPF